MYFIPDYGPKKEIPENVFVFEGPEKRLEVNFEFNSSRSHGLRSIGKTQWQEMLDLVRCTIISSSSNQFMDSYVLSESSLFVYPFKIVLKTCGTTTLLNCLDRLGELSAECATSIESVLFSRKNYNFPEKQVFPHNSFQTEVDRLQKLFKGTAHILGPALTGDHHYIYASGPSSAAPGRSKIPSQDYLYRTSFEMLMSELDPDAMKYFYRNEYFVDAKTTTRETGQASVLPGMLIDEVMFDPCGFSLNGICENDNSYFTVHVTPEPHCSFVSFETNADCATERSLIERVARIFRPGRFSLVLSSPSRDPADHEKFGPEVEGYIRRCRTHYELEGGYTVTCCNYSLDTIAASSSLAA